MTVIRVIDFETSGMEPPAEVIEVGLCDLVQEGGDWRVMRPVDWLCGTDQQIEPGARAAHHITKADVEGWDRFDAVALWDRAKAEGVAVVAAHNLDYEAKYWGEAALPLLCTYKAALRVWPDAPAHSNSVLRYWLEDNGLLALDHATAMPPHRAGPDAYVTAHILKALLTAGATGRDMVAWTREPRLFPHCPIGKFRGKPWAEVEAGFLGWMLRQPDMDADLKWNAQREIARRGGEQQ